MQHRQAYLLAHVTCWACILMVLVSGTGQTAAGPTFPPPALAKQATAFLHRLGVTLHGEVVCAAVTIGPQAYVCQALGSLTSPDTHRPQAQLLAFYCSPEGVCWFPPARVP